MQETHRKTKQQYQKILHTTRCEHRNCFRRSQSKRLEGTHLPSGARIQLDTRGVFPLDTPCVRDRMRTQGTWQWQLYRQEKTPSFPERQQREPSTRLTKHHIQGYLFSPVWLLPGRRNGAVFNKWSAALQLSDVTSWLSDRITSLFIKSHQEALFVIGPREDLPPDVHKAQASEAVQNSQGWEDICHFTFH